MGFFSRALKPEQPRVGRSIYSYSAGTPITPDTSMEISSYYRGVIYVSTQIAKLPWYVKDEKNQKKYGRTSKLLNTKPNPEMTAFQFRLLMIQTAIHKGNAYAEVERDVLGRPVWLWPMPTESVQPMRDPKGSLMYRVMGGKDGGDVYLRPDDVLHFKNFHTNDGIMGLSLISYAKEALGIAKGADIMANSLYANGGLPSGVLNAPGTLSEEAVKRIKEGWTAAHSGRKAGGVAVLEEGVTYQGITINPDELQFLESRKFSVLEIARFIGIPPTKLFGSENATYSNVEHANIEVATDTLDAWARNLEAEIDCKLLFNSRENLKSEMDLHAVFRGDMNTRSQYFTRMMQAAAITPNEIRDKEGLEPYADGNRYFVATNNFTPADRVDEVVDSQINKSEEPIKKDKSDEEVNNAVLNYLRK